MDSTEAYLIGKERTHGITYRHGEDTRSILILFASYSFAESN